MYRFEKSLRRKFDENPLAAPTYPYWPDRCLSVSCAEWAIDSVVAFVEAFRDLMNPESDAGSGG